jgi:shikimate dehydrogenase
MVVADVAFNPPHAQFLHEATEKGCRTIDGLEIFIDQTALNFRLWMGIDPDRAVLRDAAEEFLEL